MTRQRHCTAPENVIPLGVHPGGIKVFCCGVCEMGFLSREELAIHAQLPDLRAGGQTHEHLPGKESVLNHKLFFRWGSSDARVTDFYQVKFRPYPEHPPKPPVGTWWVRVEALWEEPRWYGLDDIVEVAFPPRSREKGIRATGLSEMNRIPIFPQR